MGQPLRNLFSKAGKETECEEEGTGVKETSSEEISEREEEESDARETSIEEISEREKEESDE